MRGLTKLSKKEKEERRKKEESLLTYYKGTPGAPLVSPLILLDKTTILRKTEDPDV
jgi:hypothetical protein